MFTQVFMTINLVTVVDLMKNAFYFVQILLTVRWSFFSLDFLAESSRVPLQYIEGVENSDYINAAFVHVCIAL